VTPSFVDKLRAALGPENVLTAPASLLVYSYDGALDKNLPGAVALPRSAEEAAACVRLAAAAGVPYTARGAGTNLCGGSVPAAGGLVIHLARLNRILEINTDNLRAWVEPGVVNLHLQNALAPLDLFYAPDPASQKASTLGGNVGTNAGGPRCLRHGVTTNHVLALEAVLPGGELLRCSVEDAGYDFTGLLVGSEGTLGVVTKIQVKLLPLPEDVQTLLAAFPSLEAAVQTVTDVISAGILPTALEVMDKTTVHSVEAFVGAGYPLDAEAVLLVETDGPRARAAAEAEKIADVCRANGASSVRRAASPEERQKLWEGRRGAYPAMARLAPNVLVEDGVVPRQLLPEAVRRIRAIAARERLRMGLIAHAGDGNLHPNLAFDERDAEETRRVKAAGYEMLKVCVDLGGSISGEHGIGVDKREAMRWLFTPATLRFFRRVKEVFDPANLCNPDKLIPLAETGAPTETAASSAPAAGPRSPEASSVPDLLRAAQKDRRPVFIRGLGTKNVPVPPGARVLETARLDKILDHDRPNFTVTVEAGVALEDLKAALAGAGQFVHVSGAGSLGGILSARSSRRPALRDQVIGLAAVLPDGDCVRLGAKVMKNVAGYDALKLFIGAWGTLGVLTEVTLRLFPFPPEEPRAEPAPRPFAPTALERRLKRALDPEGILNNVFFEDGHGRA
jgi:glycolate oxidase subunit GlcD